jgi:hypothetical protein
MTAEQLTPPAEVPRRPLRGVVKRQDDERRWRQILDPIAFAHCELVNAIEDYVAGLPDDVLADHLRAAEWPTSTNCWWASYNVAPLLRQAVRHEQYVRRLRAKETSRG